MVLSELMHDGSSTVLFETELDFFLKKRLIFMFVCLYVCVSVYAVYVCAHAKVQKRTADPLEPELHALWAAQDGC